MQNRGKNIYNKFDGAKLGPGGYLWIHEKTQGQKSHATVSFFQKMQPLGYEILILSRTKAGIVYFCIRLQNNN